jgi:hypothetical protein
MNTIRQVQQFKRFKRRELRQKHAAGEVKVADFTLAAANKVKHQPLDVSRVEVSDYEVTPDS